MNPKIKLIERVWSGSICRNSYEIYTPELELANIITFEDENKKKFKTK